MSENRELSDVMIEFVSRLEADGVDEVSLELVKLRWIPEVAALEAKAEWKDAFDEGQVIGMHTTSTDAENPYPKGSNPYAGWSFGFWRSRDRSRRFALEARLEAIDQFEDLKQFCYWG